MTSSQSTAAVWCAARCTSDTVQSVHAEADSLLRLRPYIWMLLHILGQADLVMLAAGERAAAAGPHPGVPPLPSAGWHYGGRLAGQPCAARRHPAGSSEWTALPGLGCSLLARGTHVFHGCHLGCLQMSKQGPACRRRSRALLSRQPCGRNARAQLQHETDQVAHCWLAMEDSQRSWSA